MRTKIIEVTQGEGGPNHGKVMVGLFTWEWNRKVALPDVPEEIGLLRSQGWHTNHVFVMDLCTGEGAMFALGGSAHADLHKHAIHVCPLFEPFLAWLYTQTLPLHLEALPKVVVLADAEPALHGYRRPGPLRCDDCGLALNPEEISIFWTRDHRRLCPGCAGQEPPANIVREPA